MTMGKAKQTTMFGEDAAPETMTASSRPKRKRIRVLQQPMLHLDPDLDAYVELAEKQRPRTRGDCATAVGDGPCPYVSCKMHLWSDTLDTDDEAEEGEDDETAKMPRRMRWFEHLVETVHPADWGETCALRVAERVVLRPSETGKHEGHSSDGEVIAVPGPVLSGSPGRRYWEPVSEEFAAPKKVDAAVLGRLCGGLSREQMRKDLNSAMAKVRADPDIRELADAMGLDLDQYMED